MKDILQPVLENYPKLNFERQSSPSYVEIYTKTNNEIVMVYSKAKQSGSGTNENNSKSIKNEQDELDLTGSPLKLDLSIHAMLDETMMSEEPQLWRKEEFLHCPIDIEKAREIANLYTKNLSTLSKEEAIPMWILCTPSEGKPLLLTIQSNKDEFTRGIVNYKGAVTLEDVDVENLMKDFAVQECIDEDLVNVSVDCKYTVSGISYGQLNYEDLLNTPHSGITELHCTWAAKTLLTPFISCKVHFEQEVIIGHLASPCNAVWKSVCALHQINELLVDMTAAAGNVDLEKAVIRNLIPGMKRYNNTKRLNELLNETEIYTYTAECPTGGCLCVTDNTTTLRQCMNDMNKMGSSNDFTYKLWDVLRDSETAEELITLLLQALTFISSGKIRPFIDVNNKSLLSKLVLKLSRGHSQTSKVLKNLRSSPPQAMSLIAQVGFEKTMWEYTRIMSLLEHSFFLNGVWSNDARSKEKIDQINQTIQDMTMGGEFTLNPFESYTTTEHSIRLDSESFCVEDTNDLTVDDFASLKSRGLVSEKKDCNEVPLIADEIDISPWKSLLMRFAQVHVCLEHLYRAETCLRADFAQLKPMASRILELYVSEKSPVKTVGQLMNDPILKINIPITNNIVQDHLKKSATWYRLELSKKDRAIDSGLKRECKLVYVYSQLPVFPPNVWQHIETPSEEVGETTTVVEEVKYHCTKYTYLSNKVNRNIVF
ncbi:protein zwilch [Colias croceus]|uniref:protein zwilch n=1 Tax=Colias crocea TaxID=72248 RepID=UPI001E27A79E|nr:protein zwilch [Colias croceus]